MMDWIVQFATSLWNVLATMAPYLLLGFLAAGMLSVLIPQRLVEKHLGGKGLWPVVKAALLGVPLPLCSCGVIPVSASLRRHGASKAATVGFLISTPQTGVDSIAVTYSLMGPVFAVFRPIAALVNGVLGGAAVLLLGKENPSPETPSGNFCGAAEAGPQRNALARMARYGFVELPQDIGKSLVVGLLAAAVIAVLVPDDFFASRMGGFFAGGIGAMLVMMALGVPVYVCATASVPMAMELMAKGVSPGAALVFLMTGPATNAATLAMIWKVMGRRTAAIYLLSVMVTALASGLTLDYIFQYHPAALAATHSHVCHVEIAAWQSVSAAALVAVLATATILKWRSARSAAATPAGEATMELKIRGMTCNHCANNVQRALAGVAGVTSATVNLAAATAQVAGENLDAAQLKAAVESLGYTVVTDETKESP